MVALGNGPLRVLIDVSPPLLAESIARLIRRDDVVAYTDLAVEPIGPEPLEIVITDGSGLAGNGADLLLRLPAEPTAATRSVLEPMATKVIDLSDLSDLVALVGALAEDRRAQSD